ncbi:hypothetical protein D3C80_2100320 [compost metagenome]
MPFHAQAVDVHAGQRPSHALHPGALVGGKLVDVESEQQLARHLQLPAFIDLLEAIFAQHGHLPR